MFVVDTNVFVAALDGAAQGHAVCRAHVERWRRGTAPWATTWNVLYEFLRVVTHTRVLRAPLALPQALAFIDALRASPSLQILGHGARHPEVLGEIVRTSAPLSGNLVFDLHTAVILKEHGVRTIVTRDVDFARFAFLDVVDPLAPGARVP